MDALFPSRRRGRRDAAAAAGGGDDDAAVEAMCRDIVGGMPEEAALFKAGKTRAHGEVRRRGDATDERSRGSEGRCRER